MEDLNKENLSGKDTEQEIDLIELARKLWSGRKIILRWGAIGIIAGIVIGLSIPKEYTTVIKLAPEASQSGGSSGNLGALAAMAGISPAGTSGKDAVNPQLYPDIVSSIPFTLELFDVKVTNSDATVTKSVKDYVSNDLSAPWSCIVTLRDMIEVLPSTSTLTLPERAPTIPLSSGVRRNESGLRFFTASLSEPEKSDLIPPMALPGRDITALHQGALRSLLT